MSNPGPYTSSVNHNQLRLSFLNDFHLYNFSYVCVKTIMGVTLAGLAEGMALADRAGLQQKDVMEVS